MGVYKNIHQGGHRSGRNIWWAEMWDIQEGTYGILYVPREVRTRRECELNRPPTLNMKRNSCLKK